MIDTRITFAVMKNSLKLELFPAGLAENLVSAVDKFFVEALIDLQRWVESYQANNTTVVDQCNTFFECGKTVVDLPRGRLQRVIIIADKTYCEPVLFRPVGWDKMEVFTNQVRPLSSDTNFPFFHRLDYIPPGSKPFLPPIPPGVAYADAVSDSPLGRAQNGMYCIHRKRLYLAPWLQSNESVVIEWDGLKREWADLDLVSSDADFLSAVKLWVQYCYARDYERDPQMSQYFRGEYALKLKDLIFESEEENKQKVDNVPRQPRRVHASLPPALSEDPLEVVAAQVALIGDYGLDDQANSQVASMVKGFSPDMIVTLGGNNMGGDDSFGSIDAIVGQRYHQYLYPYAGSYGAGATGKNIFWPAIGNTDRDTSLLLAQFKNFFPLPGGKTYYKISKGPIDIFVLDSGINSIGSTVGPDGNAETSVQGIWLRAALAVSTASFKIVVIHHPPYSSSSDLTDGQFAVLRWPFKIWGASAIISSFAHSYERLVVDGLTYIVCGAGGGAPLTGYRGGIPSTSQARNNTDYGGLILSATCDTLHIKFYNVSSELIDTFEILPAT